MANSENVPLQKDFILRLIRNAELLVDEAKILQKASADKRAAFLAITAYEEIAKLVLLAKGSKKWDMAQHKNKFKEWNELTTEAIRSDIAPDLAEQLLTKMIANGLDHTQYSALAETMVGRITDLIANAFDLTALRQALLYEDTDQKVHGQLASDATTLSRLTSWLIEMAETRVKMFTVLVAEAQAASKSEM